MIGMGVDILKLSRVRGIANLSRAAEYVLTQKELDEFVKRPDKVEFFASRFATKEAVIKAFPMRISPHDFIIEKENKKPVVTLLSDAHKGYRVLVSLSHSQEYVAGFAAVLGV